jgi:hypothetical protein
VPRLLKMERLVVGTERAAAQLAQPEDGREQENTRPLEMPRWMHRWHRWSLQHCPGGCVFTGWRLAVPRHHIVVDRLKLGGVKAIA